MQIDLPNSKARVGKTAPGPMVIDGKAFTRLVREATPTARAFYAFDLQVGNRVLSPMTSTQARLVSGCSQGYQATVLGLSDHERQLVLQNQASLAHFHTRIDSDDEVIRAVLKFGPDRILSVIGPDQITRALDIMTAPAIAAE